MPEREDGEQVQAALAAVWERERPVLLERVAAVERAAAASAGGAPGGPAPGAETIEAGRAAAHKLAGVLGTFGLGRGTELARELEARLGEADPGLPGLAAELRAVVEGAGGSAAE